MNGKTDVLKETCLLLSSRDGNAQQKWLKSNHGRTQSLKREKRPSVNDFNL